MNNVDMMATSSLEMQAFESLVHISENLVATPKQSADPICFCAA